MAKGKKMKRNMSVAMCRVEDDRAAFVEGTYQDRLGKVKRGLMMLDSGSNVNALFKWMWRYVAKDKKRKGKKQEIVGMGPVKAQMKTTGFSFTLGEENFEEKFVVMDSVHKIMVGRLPVIGLLGNVFMQQYRLALDYSTHTLHTSEIVPKDFVIEDCDFFFPMTLGLCHYSMPVVGVKKGEEEMIALIDSGSTDNHVASGTLRRNGYESQTKDEINPIYGIGGMLVAKETVIDVDMIGFASANETTLHRYRDTFMVSEQDVITNEIGEDIPPVEFVFGSPFLGREGWVLDFGAKAMYKRKSA